MPPRTSLARLQDRPTADLWLDDELITINEAAALFCPQGPFTVGGLRRATERRELAFKVIAGRLYTTPAAIKCFLALNTLEAPTASSTVKLG